MKTKFLILLFLSLTIAFPIFAQDFWLTMDGPFGANANNLEKNGGRIFVSLENGGIYFSDNNGTIWTKSGLGSISVNSILTLNASTLLAGTKNNGTYKSTDNGSTWFHSSFGFSEADVYDFIVDTLGNVFAATNQGVYKSTDLGNNWTKKNSGFASFIVNKFLSDTTSTLIAATTNGGIFRSTDNGENWVRQNNVLFNETVNTLVLHSDGSIFAGTESIGIYKSIDGGVTWEEKNTGFGNYNVSDLQYFSTGGNSRFIALVNSFENGGLFVSLNEGDSWQRINGYKSKFPNSALILDVNDFITASMDFGLLRSSDGGVTWNEVNTGVHNSHITSSFIYENSEMNQVEVYVGTYNGVYSSIDYGENWINKSGNLPNKFINDILFTEKIYAATNEGIYSTTDGGISWINTSSGINAKVNGIIFSDGDYYAAAADGIYKSTNAGATWSQVGLFNTNVNSITVGMNGEIIAGADNVGVFISSDNGLTWPQTSLNSFSITSLTVDQSYIYAGTRFSGVYRSGNDGLSWQQVNFGLGDLGVDQLFADSRNRVYVSTVQSGVHRTANQGVSWINLNSGIGDNRTSTFAEDNTGHVYSGSLGAGAFLSTEPVLQFIESSQLSYFEDGVPVDLTDSIFISDISQTVLDSAVIRITENLVADEDSLVFEDQGSILGFYDKANGWLSLIGNDIAVNYITALRSVKYFNRNSADPDSVLKNISFKVYKGENGSNSLSRKIKIHQVNDTPVLAGIPDVVMTENTTSQVKLNDYLVDVDNQLSEITYSAQVITADTLAKVGVEDLDVSINQETGIATFTPSTDSTGIFKVVFKAEDIFSASDTDTINVTVEELVNVPPVLTGMPDITFTEDDSTTINLGNYVTDENDNLADLIFDARVTKAFSLGKSLTIKRTVLDNGNIVFQVGLDDLMIELDNNEKTARLKASADSSGLFAVIFSVTDPYLETDEDSIFVTVAPVNDPPYIVSHIADHVFDEDSGPHTVLNDVSLVFGDNDPKDVHIYSVASTSNSIFASLDDKALIVDSERDFFGSGNVILTATDGGNVSVSDTFKVTILPVNDAPVVSGLPMIRFDEDNQFTFDLDNYVTDVDNEAGQLIWSFDFPESTRSEKANSKDDLWLNKKFESNVELVSSKSGKGEHGYTEGIFIIANDSIYVIIDPISHVVEISALTNYFASDIPIAFTAKDPEGLTGSDTTAITISPVNDPPVVNELPVITFPEDDSLTYLISNWEEFITDVDNEFGSLTFTFNVHEESRVILEIVEENISFKLSAGENWYGEESISVLVGDGIDTTEAEFIVNVLPVNDPPEFENVPSTITFKSDTSYILNVWDLVSDLETPDSLLIFDFIASSDTLVTTYNVFNGNLTLSVRETVEALYSLIIKVTDDSSSVAQAIIDVDIEFGAEHWTNQIPLTYELLQNYPNPFNPETTIRFGVPVASDVSISIFNTIGERVYYFNFGEHNPGYYEFTIQPEGLASGVYIYTMYAKAVSKGSDSFQSKKMILLK
ncbi:MAG: hypothetical protein K8F36_03550 [Melioribacteraceae bacterium]|nr:hypothetical protein [Melioribacteraceae bacterium]